MIKTKRTYLALLAVLLSPMVANADIIRINYTGTVDEVGGAGFGYAVGDTIMGWFEFDTDDWLLGIDYTELNGPVTSNTGDGGYADADDYGELCTFSDCGAEGIYLVDGSWEYGYEDLYDDLENVVGYSEFEAGHYHIFEWYSDGEPPGLGIIYEYALSYECVLETCGGVEYENYAIFTVDFVSVPEPGTLALFGIGLFGIGLARRRKKD